MTERKRSLLHGRYASAMAVDTGDQAVSLEQQITRYGKFLVVGLLFFVGVVSVLVYGYWIQAHMRAAYRDHVDIETPKKELAMVKWQTYCDPQKVPNCDDLKNGTLTGMVCLVDNGARAWLYRPGQPQADHEDCALLRRNATHDIHHSGMGVAFNEVCAHAPVLNWLCGDCSFVDPNTKEASWLYKLGQFLTTEISAWRLLCLALGLSGLSSFVPLYALVMRCATRNSLNSLTQKMNWGSTAGSSGPETWDSLSATRVDALLNKKHE